MRTCNDAKVCLGLERVEHLDDVFMAQGTQNLNLLAQVLDVLLALAVLRTTEAGALAEAENSQP